MIFLVPFDIIQILTCMFLGKQLSTSLFFHHPLELEPGFDSNKRGLTSVYSGIAPIELEGIIEIQPKIHEILRVVAKYIVCVHAPLKKKGSIVFFINFSIHKKGIDFAPYPHVTDQQNEAQRGCVHPSFAPFLPSAPFSSSSPLLSSSFFHFSSKSGKAVYCEFCICLS